MFHQRVENFFQLDFSLQLEILGIHRQPLGAQGDLGTGLFAADVQHTLDFRQIRQRLQQQGRFADTRIAADQHYPAGHQSAAEHPVEFLDTGAEARHVDSFDVGQSHYRCSLRQALVLIGKTVADRFDDGFHQCVPLPARRALAGPFVGDTTAFGAGVIGFSFGHAIP